VNVNQAATLPAPLARDATRAAARHGLRHVLGADAWQRLPEAVRERFAEGAPAVNYAGAFEVVRANWLGRVFAVVGMLFGNPVAPRGGTDVAARVMVRPVDAGVLWTRVYEWADGRADLVRSTKVVTAAGTLTEQLPARLHMPLRVYEASRVLHFESRGYYFDLGFGLRLPLPALLSPGVTHVEHIDLGHGWFRFTMTVTHPQFGELFFQTGRFCATEDET
jgi:hypothetical protein